jgi:S1-C subfamily serine protease
MLRENSGGKPPGRAPPTSSRDCLSCGCRPATRLPPRCARPFSSVTAHLVVPFDNHGPAAEEQKLQGRAECGWAGVRVSPMTTPFADSLGLVASYGAIFDRPEPGSPAARAKIEAGDVLTAIDGVPLEKWRDFEGIIAKWAPGSTVYLNTWRDGQVMPRDVTLGSSRCPNL